MTLTPVEIARHRLEVLHEDISAHGGENRMVNWNERNALRIVLDELHRLNLAVSSQLKTLQSIADRKKSEKQSHRKPAGAQSQHAATHSTPQIANKTKGKS